MRKILFTDLDGTLLKDDKTVSQKNQQAIHEMLQAGHCMVVATGRAMASGVKIVKSLNLTLPGCYLIAFNGGVIYDCNAKRTLSEKTLSMEYVEYLFQEARRLGMHVHTYDDRYLLSERSGKELDFYLKNTDIEFKLAENVPRILKKEPHKVLFVELENEQRLKQFQKDHLSWQEGKCSSFFSCPEYLEYCPLGVDKGIAVKSLCRMLGIDIANAYGVGDERNDISMIEAVGIGFAMKNGHEDIKAVADYITERDNEHDAIAEIIENNFLC